MDVKEGRVMDMKSHWIPYLWLSLLSSAPPPPHTSCSVPPRLSTQLSVKLPLCSPDCSFTHRKLHPDFSETSLHFLP